MVMIGGVEFLFGGLFDLFWWFTVGWLCIVFGFDTLGFVCVWWWVVYGLGWGVVLWGGCWWVCVLVA